MRIDQAQATHIEAFVARSAAQRGAAMAPSLSVELNPLAPIWDYLSRCEAILIDFMAGGEPTAEGPTLEWGLMLFILNNPTQFGLKGWVETVLHKLGMPASRIDQALWDSWIAKLEGPGVVCGDGSIMAITQWNALDPAWTLTLVTYVYYRRFPDQIAPFGTNPQTIAVEPAGDKLVIGLISDWGTGPWTDGAATCPSEAVLANLKRHNPDVIVHLGDTYYAGLPWEITGNLTGPITGAAPKMFTLNANHEMYDGANGYFGTALASDGPFSLQNGTSYFALTYGNTVIVGLDTAYFDTSMLYLDGALNDPHQIAFLKNLDLAGKTVILLTHHNPISVTGEQPESLWGDVTAVLNPAPTYWYWGHIHDGIVYSEKSAAGATKARCIGHAALPFGKPYNLQPKGQPMVESVTAYAHTRFPNPDTDQQNRVLNGFAVLEIAPDGTVAETFYDQDGNTAWSSAAPSAAAAPGADGALAG